MKITQAELEQLSKWEDDLYSADGIVGYWVLYEPENNFVRVTKYLLRRKLYMLLDLCIDTNTLVAKSIHGDGRDCADMLYKEVLKLNPEKLRNNSLGSLKTAGS